LDKLLLKQVEIVEHQEQLQLIPAVEVVETVVVDQQALAEKEL